MMLILTTPAIFLALLCATLVECFRPDFCSDKNSMDEFFADPEDCSYFYRCILRTSYSFKCPPGLLFNERYKACDWPYNVYCNMKRDTTSLTKSTPKATFSTFTSMSTQKSITSTGKTSTGAVPLFTDSQQTSILTRTERTTKTSNSITSTTELSKTSDSITSTKELSQTSDNKSLQNALWTTDPTLRTFCQDKYNGLYADPQNCAAFYQCSDGHSYHYICQEGLLYNFVSKDCDHSGKVNCSTPKDYQNISETKNRNETTRTVPLMSTETVTSTPAAVSMETVTSTSAAVSTEKVNSTSARKCAMVVCYYPNWAKNRIGSGASFGPQNINASLCTHIIYAFAYLQGNRLVAINPADEARGGDVGNYARVTSLKNSYPQLKILLAVGGWNMDQSLFSKMAATVESRREFITTSIEFLRSRNFDGLDIDWEYPSTGENAYINKERFAILCEELRVAFDREASEENRLLLASAVSAGKYNIDVSYDVPRLSAALDIFNVMTYDLHGTWDRQTGHNSPLKAGSWEFGDAYLNVEWVANYWVTLGAPKNKLAIGIPLYARTFRLSSTSNTGVGAPILGAGFPGKYTAEGGVLSYYEVCTMFNQSIKFIIQDQQVPYLVSGDQWVGYDDPESVREKVRFISNNGYGGVMVWDISFDDFSGQFCGQGRNPLMNSIASQCALQGSLS